MDKIKTSSLYGNMKSNFTLEDYVRILNQYQELQTENQQLKEKINQYENPDDLTLFYMWLDEKAKDKMKQLKLDYELYKDNHTYKNYEVERKDITIKHLKSTLEEIREVIKQPFTNYSACIKAIDEIELLIDKGVNNE